MSRILASPITLWIAFAYLFAAFCVTLTWYLPQLSLLMPRWLEQWMYPIDKTDLDVLRFAHFLALAAVTVRFLPKDWPGLKSPWLRPLILCGQHSLEIFCLGVFLAFAGHFVLAEVSGGAGLHFIVSISGILIMCGAAWLFSWYKHSADKSGSRKKSTLGNADLAGGSYEVRFEGHVGLMSLAGLLAASPLRAEDTAPRCEVPAYLLATDSTFARVADAVKSGRSLEILVIGSRSSTIPTSEASAYPARLQAMLQEKLPATMVNLSVDLQPKKTAEDVASGFVKLMEERSRTWWSGRPERSMPCGRSIPMIFAAPSTRALLRCKRRVPTLS